MAMSPFEAFMNMANLGASLAAAFRGGAHSGATGTDNKAIKAFVSGGGPELIKQQMPHLFGMGFVENSITATLLRQIGEPGAKDLEELGEEMSDYERYFFWMTFASVKNSVNIADAVTKDEDKKGNGHTQTVTQSVSQLEFDERLATLRMVVGMIQASPNRDMKAVIRSLYNRRILEKSVTMKTWAYLSNTFRTSVLEPCGANSFKELVNSPKLKQWLAERVVVPDLRKPGPPVGLAMRIARAVTPGSYGSAKRPREGRTVLGILVGIGIALVLAFGVAQYYGYFSDRPLTKQNKSQDEINLLLKNYQPTPLSADKPNQ